MVTEVLACIDAKVNHLKTYFIIPPDRMEEIEKFKEELITFGEAFSDAMVFESAFASSELAPVYYSFFTSLSPNPNVQVADPRIKTVSEAISENKEEYIRAVAKGAAEIAEMEIESTAISMKRQAMIEAGVFDEYTRATNMAEDARRVLGFLKNKTKK